MRLAIVVLGLAATQVLLYGPSLAGRKFLLPLDILQAPRYYLPITPETRGYVPENGTLVDQIISIELRRRYAAREVRAGRLPLWNPYNYCGAPFIAANNTAVFSPFRLLDYAFPGPVTVAWTQLLKALVGGLGMYGFCRRCLKVGFWPAAVGAWCFPLTGFLILWQGYPPSFVATWLPWVIWATDAAVRRPGGWGGLSLALATAALLVSGHAATAAHALLVSGMYALWAIGDQYGWRSLFTLPAVKGAAAVLAGWTLGVLVTSPQNLPTIEYLQHSQRVARRQAGRIEFPSVGPAALPQIVLPYFYGSYQRGSLYIAPGGTYQDNIYYHSHARLEGPAQGYGGLVMTLFLAPLAFVSRRHRSASILWLLVALLGAAHILGIPALSHALRVFPLKLLQNHRFIFATAFAAVVLGVMGLDVLRRGVPRWRWGFWIPFGLLATLAATCFMRAGVLPEPIQQLSAARISAAQKVAIANWFVVSYASSFLLCSAVAVLWLAVWWPTRRQRVLAAMAAVIAVGEMIWVSRGVNPQCDPELYYPKLEILERLREEAPPGRICGVDCLPACLNQASWLSDIRGYDGASPAALMDLFALCPLYVDGRRVDNHNVSGTQWFIPPPSSPILDMLNLRYRIHRGEPSEGADPLMTAPDYWIEESPTALARVFVPERVETLATSEETLTRLAQTDFDPRRIAYVTSDATIDVRDARGTAEIAAETASEITIDADMQTPGVVVLADLYYTGWRAWIDDREVPILRTNHALRGIELPAGMSRIVLRYQPETFRRGLWLMGISLMLLGGWAAVLVVGASR